MKRMSLVFTVFVALVCVDCATTLPATASVEATASDGNVLEDVNLVFGAFWWAVVDPKLAKAVETIKAKYKDKITWWGSGGLHKVLYSSGFFSKHLNNGRCQGSCRLCLDF